MRIGDEFFFILMHIINRLANCIAECVFQGCLVTILEDDDALSINGEDVEREMMNDAAQETIACFLLAVAGVRSMGSG
jgi:hypothetical protein